MKNVRIIRRSATAVGAAAVAALLFLQILPAASAILEDSQANEAAVVKPTVEEALSGFFASATLGSPPPPGAHGVGVFDTATAQWHLRTRGGDPTVFLFGDANDIPLVGDWDNDGTDTIGVYDPETGVIELRNTNSPGAPDVTYSIAELGLQPFAGDFNGDGFDSVGVFDPATGTVHIFNATTGALTLGGADESFAFATAGDIAFAGDFSRNGIDTVASYDPTNGEIEFRGAGAGGIPSNFTFSAPTGLFVVGDWDGDGVDTPGVFDEELRTMHLRDTNTAGGPDESVAWGKSASSPSTLVPVAGDFGPLSSGVSVILPFAPQGLIWAIESHYLEHPRGVGATLSLTGSFGSADAFGAAVAVAVMDTGTDTDTDTILAVSDDGWGWRVVGAHMASESGAQSLGGGPRFVTLIGTDWLDGHAPPGTDTYYTNADSVHIYSVVPEIGKGAIVGIPRDTIMEYTGPGSFNGRAELHKVNVGNGPGVTNAVITANTGIPIEGYFQIGMGINGDIGFRQLVGAMGGIDPFHVPYSVISQCFAIAPPPAAVVGDTSISALGAIQLARERNCVPKDGEGRAIGVNGNAVRTLSQGLMMKAVVANLQTVGIAALPLLLDTMDDFVRTDLSVDDVLTIAASIYTLDPGAMPTLTEADFLTYGIGAYDLNPGTLPIVNVDGCVGSFKHKDGIEPHEYAYAQFMQPVNQAVFDDLADGVLDTLPIPKFDSGSWTHPTSCPWLAINHFPDVLPEAWYFKYVESLWGNDIAEGYLDGTFRPANLVPRREMAPFMVRAVGQTKNVLTGPPDPFPDVAWHNWYAEWVDKLVELGIAEGDPDGTFKPDRNLNRAEVAVLIVRALGHTVPPAPSLDPFSDVSQGAWYGGWVAKLKELGLTTGYPDGSYRPNNSVSRAEFAAMLDRAFLSG